MATAEAMGKRPVTRAPRRPDRAGGPGGAGYRRL